MKRSFLLLLIVFSSGLCFAQDKGTSNITGPQDVQQRIDALLRTNQYSGEPDDFRINGLVSLGTKIRRDTASCTLGKLKKKSKKIYKPAYVVRYSIKADKIVAIDVPKKKKKRFLLF